MPLYFFRSKISIRQYLLLVREFPAERTQKSGWWQLQSRTSSLATRVWLRETSANESVKRGEAGQVMSPPSLLFNIIHKGRKLPLLLLLLGQLDTVTVGSTSAFNLFILWQSKICCCMYILERMKMEWPFNDSGNSPWTHYWHGGVPDSVQQPLTNWFQALTCSFVQLLIIFPYAQLVFYSLVSLTRLATPSVETLNKIWIWIYNF